jgi:fibronectin type 3 domain-containing protein
MFISGKRVILIIALCILILPIYCFAERITLAWDASQGATGYKIYSGTSSGSYPWVIDVSNVYIYTTEDLINFGTTYYFAATAYDATNESDYSLEVSYRLLPKIPENVRLVSF